MTRTIPRLMIAGTAALAFAFPASAQMTEDELAAGIAELADDREALSGVLESMFGVVPDEHEPIYLDYLADILSQPALPGYLHDRFPPEEGEDAAQYFGRISYDVSEQVVTAGIARLPTEMQFGYVELSTGVFDWIMENEPEACAVVAGGTIDEMTDLEARYQATLTAEQITAVTELNRAAIVAEIEDQAPANDFTPEQMAEAETAIAEAFEAKLLAYDNPDALLAAAMGQAENPTDYCELAALTFEIFFDLEEPELGYALQLTFDGAGM